MMNIKDLKDWSSDDLLAFKRAILEELRRRSTSDGGLTFAPCKEHECKGSIAWCKTEYENWIALEKDPNGPFNVVDGVAVWVGPEGKYAPHFRKGNCPQISVTTETPADQSE